MLTELERKNRVKVLLDKFPHVEGTFVAPFKYDDYGQMIFDKDNNLVVEIRGWGHIQHLDNPQERQDDIGNLITHLLNEVLDK